MSFDSRSAWRFLGTLAFAWPVVLILVVVVIILSLSMCSPSAHAATVDRIVIPPTSTLYRIKLEREVAARLGNTDAVARIAAQIHNESRWNPKAQSPYANGMAQFTPSTATWLIQSVCPEIGAADPWDPNWSVRAVVCYDHFLYKRTTGASDCDRWGFALSGYNGGEGWVKRDRARASASGADSARWFGHVENFTTRAQWARVENRNYVRRILMTVEPFYIQAGWPGVLACREPSFREVRGGVL